MAQTFAALGLTTRSQPFDCLDWRHDGARFMVAERAFDVQVSPYSLGCRA